MAKNKRITTSDFGATRRHAFDGTNERCETCGYKRAFFLHNAPHAGTDWAKAAAK